MCVCVLSVPQLIYGGNLDFLVFDYLSEITMSLLTAAKARSPVSEDQSLASIFDADHGKGDTDDEDVVLLADSWFHPRLCPGCCCSVHQ